MAEQVQALDLRITGLRQAIDDLAAAVPQTFNITPRNLIAQYAVLGYIREICEMASATAMLAESDTPRASFATARTAFEAAQDLLYMVKAPDIGIAGAQARVAELLDGLDTQEHERITTSAMLGTRPVPISTWEVDDTVLADAAFLDGIKPTAGQVLWDALAVVRDHRERRQRWHWSGLTRRELSEQLHQLYQGRALFDIFDTMYGVLSRHSHPAPRFDPRFMAVEPNLNVTLVITPTAEDRESIVAIPIASALLAVKCTTLILPEAGTALSA